MRQLKREMGWKDFYKILQNPTDTTNQQNAASGNTSTKKLHLRVFLLSAPRQTSSLIASMRTKKKDANSKMRNALLATFDNEPALVNSGMQNRFAACLTEAHNMLLRIEASTEQPVYAG